MGALLRVGAGAISAVVGLAMVGIAIGLILLIRTQYGVPSAFGVGEVTSMTADELMASGATAIEAALARDGDGLTFEVVQRNTMYAKPGGPLIGVREPDDPGRVVEEVDEFYVNGITSRGAITHAAFWMGMRFGPDKDQAPDFDRAPQLYRVLERDWVLWRDDGDGWYLTDVSPGTGMDPVTARLLPKLLRSAIEIAPLEPQVIDGRLLAGVKATARVEDYPGVVASDGKEFTEPSFEVRYWFDDEGRLVRLEASARHLGAEVYDLVSETVVTFGYGATGDPPEPSPTMGPEPTPIPDPADVEAGS